MIRASADLQKRVSLVNTSPRYVKGWLDDDGYLWVTHMGQTLHADLPVPELPGFRRAIHLVSGVVIVVKEEDAPEFPEETPVKKAGTK